VPEFMGDFHAGGLITCASAAGYHAGEKVSPRLAIR
jgi:hypothetical protein